MITNKEIGNIATAIKAGNIEAVETLLNIVAAKCSESEKPRQAADLCLVKIIESIEIDNCSLSSILSVANYLGVNTNKGPNPNEFKGIYAEIKADVSKINFIFNLSFLNFEFKMEFNVVNINEKQSIYICEVAIKYKKEGSFILAKYTGGDSSKIEFSCIDKKRKSIWHNIVSHPELPFSKMWRQYLNNFLSVI